MKIVKRLVILLVVLLILAVGALTFLVPPAAKKAVEGGSTYALGVPTTLDRVLLGLSPSTSEVGLEELLISNPEGFGEEGVLDLGRASVQIDTFSLLSDVLVIPEIRLEDVELRVVQDGKRSNLMVIHEHLSRLTGGGDGADDAPASDEPDAGDAPEGDPGPKMQVGLVHLSGIAATFDLRGVPGIADTYRYELPPFELDLSDEGPQDMAGLLSAVLDELSARGLARAKQELPPEIAALLDGGALSFEGLKARAGEALEEATDQVQDAAQEGAAQLQQDLQDGKDPEQAVKDAAEKAKQGLGGLLGGKGDGE